MYTLGRFLQVFGLIIVPMALLYYFSNQGRADEAKLMFGELSILAAGAGSFVVGNALVSKSSG